MLDTSARVLLIYPPSHTQYHTSCPSGIQMVAAVLEKAGHQVHLIDANAVESKKTSEEIARIVETMKPDVIGMTLLTPMIREAYRLVGLLKGSGARLLAGGPHATMLPEEPLAFGFDAVVIGEGESTAVEAVRALRGKMPPEDVKGWVYLDEAGRPRHTAPRPPVEDLDTLPWPARHLVNPLDYSPRDTPSLHANIFSSRGCPARCSYCAGSLFGRRFRFRSAQSVLEEMFALNEEYGTTRFHFVDDAMSMNKPRVQEICDGLARRGSKLTWSMMTRIDAVDEELLKVVSRAGCVRIDYGVESGNPETLRRIHKPHTVEMARKVVPMTAAYGIDAYVFFILGFPWEDVEALEATTSLMRELAPHVACFHPAIASVLVPFPCTEIYETYKKQYDLENWWLSEDRSYDAPTPATHSYFQRRLFPLGAVLDADFFRYSQPVRRKILEVFKFMYVHDLRSRGVLSRSAHRALIELSMRLDDLSPPLEKRVFSWLASASRFTSVPHSPRSLTGSSGCSPSRRRPGSDSRRTASAPTGTTRCRRPAAPGSGGVPRRSSR